MKRPGLTSAFVSATLFLTFAPALPAQDMMASEPAAKAARRSDELLKRFDQNGDGKLDDDERADAKEMMLKDQVDRQMARGAALPGGLEQFRAEALQMFDQNRDGRLDDDERIAAEKFAVRRGDGAFNSDEMEKRFDQNGDGKLDSDERAKLESYLSALRSLGTVRIRFDLLRRFDLNADGKVDEREFVELEKFVRPRVEASADQLRRHDTNGDGKLDDAEWVAARATIAQWLNASGPAALENERMAAEDPARKPGAEIEQARLNAVAEEVARRRAERAAVGESELAPK